jgi:hypothetical protein
MECQEIALQISEQLQTDMMCRYSTLLCVQKVQHELLTQYENQLLEKEHSGCHALLRDDKVNKWIFIL